MRSDRYRTDGNHVENCGNTVKFSIYQEKESRTIQGTWTSPSIGSQVRPRLCSKYDGGRNVRFVDQVGNPITGQKYKTEEIVIRVSKGQVDIGQSNVTLYECIGADTR